MTTVRMLTPRLLLGVFLALSVLAENILADTQIRIGVLNVARILQDAPQARKAKLELEKEFTPKDNKLVDMEDSIGKLERTLRRKGRTMEPQKRQRLADQIRQKKKKFGQLSQEVRTEFSRRRNEELKKIHQLISKIITKIAKQKNIDLILGDPYIHASERINMTQEVIDELKKFKSSSAK